MRGIAFPLALLGLVGSARGIHLSAPVSGLACDSDVEGETLELGHRQLDVTIPLNSGISLCADECEQIEGCTTFHVMQSHGCIDDVGPDVCVPWAECTFFSRCEALDQGASDDWTSTAYFLTDRTGAPAVPSTAQRRSLEHMMGSPAMSSAMPLMAAVNMMGSMVGMASLAVVVDYGGVELAATYELPSAPPAPPGAPLPSGMVYENKPAQTFEIKIKAEGNIEDFNTDTENGTAADTENGTAAVAALESGLRNQTSCLEPWCQMVVTVTVDLASTTGGRRLAEDTDLLIVATVTEAIVEGSVSAKDRADDLTPDTLNAALGAALGDLIVVTEMEVTEAIVVPGGITAAVPTASPPSVPPAPPLVPFQEIVDSGSLQSAESEKMNDTGLGVGLGLGIGIPCLCAFFFMLYVQFKYPKKGRDYLKWRFSHSNASIVFGYKPKVTRDAMWADIKAQKAPEPNIEVELETDKAVTEKTATKTDRV